MAVAKAGVKETEFNKNAKNHFSEDSDSDSFKQTDSNLSVVYGAHPVPLRYDTIGSYFDKTVERYPDNLALVSCEQGIRWTYKGLQERVDDFAKGLIALGFHPGDRLGIWSPNNAEWVITQLATAKLGIILVNINPAYKAPELMYALQKVGCKGLVLKNQFKSSHYLEMLGTCVSEIHSPLPLKSETIPSLEVVIQIGDSPTPYPGVYRFEDIPSFASVENDLLLSQISDSLSPDDAINIQFTSGTTGHPKGATLTHFNILNNGFFTTEILGLGETDVLCLPVPLYHCFGMVMGNLGCFSHGAAVVLPSEGFNPLKTLQAIESEKCTALYGVPTMFLDQLAHPQFSEFDLTSLRTGIMSGAPCPEHLMKKALNLMHLTEITICYGMTETSPVSFQTRREAPISRRISSVGTVHPHVEVKIVDPETGETVPINTCGEIRVRGYSVMKGYWNEPEKNLDAIDTEGWMQTGDLGVIDSEGYCQIVGRSKDMILRGGENIYPREVEAFLYTHPDIQEVQCFGIPDAHYGEVMAAWIQLKAECKDSQSFTLEALQQFCHGKISHQKIPVWIKIVESFPMTATGKIQKYKMREESLKGIL